MCRRIHNSAILVANVSHLGYQQEVSSVLLDPFELLIQHVIWILWDLDLD